MVWLERVRLIVEVPVAPKDAKRRGLPNGMARVILDASPSQDRGVAVELLASAVKACSRQGEILYAAPINPFEPAVAIQARIQSIAHTAEIQWVDRELGVAAIDGSCSLAEFLRSCHSEAVVIVFGAIEELVVSAMRQALSERRSSNQYEIPFFRHVELHQGFVFYAASHCSMEILGTPSFVLHRCLLPIVATMDALLHHEESVHSHTGSDF